MAINDEIRLWLRTAACFFQTAEGSAGLSACRSSPPFTVRPRQWQVDPCPGMAGWVRVRVRRCRVSSRSGMARRRWHFLCRCRMRAAHRQAPRTQADSLCRAASPRFGPASARTLRSADIVHSAAYPSPIVQSEPCCRQGVESGFEAGRAGRLNSRCGAVYEYSSSSMWAHRRYGGGTALGGVVPGTCTQRNPGFFGAEMSHI